MDESALPIARERFALFHEAVDQFQAAGYRWIGLDHFAKPDDPLALAAGAGRLHRNFMGYTTRTGERLLGVGVSAISEIDGWFLQHTAELPFDMFTDDIEPMVDRFEPFLADGLVTFETDKVVVTPLGRFFLRNLCVALDAYRGAADGGQRFSRAV